MKDPSWSNEDPRHVLIDHKFERIVILRPHADGTGWEAGMGVAGMEHGWYIHTSFEDHPSVEKWDPLWLWTLAPDQRK